MSQSSRKRKPPLLSEKILEDLLTCSICHEIYKSPIALSCLHSFCSRCLEEWESQQQLLSQIRCPACNQTTKLGSDGVADLVADFRIQALIDVVFSESASKTVKQSPLACDCCEHEPEDEPKDEDVQYCLQCTKFFCSSCIIKHKAQPVLSDHQVVNIQRHQTHQTEEILCKAHAAEAIQFLCETCPKVLCTLCIIEHSPQHTISHINVDESAVDSCRTNLESQKVAIAKKLEEVNLKLEEGKDDAQSTAAEPSATLEEAKKSVADKAEELVRKVRDFEKKLLVDVEQMLSQTEEEIKDAALTHKGILEMLISDLEEVLDGTPESIIINHKRLTEQVSSVGPSPFDVSEVCVDFSSLSLK